MRFTKMHGIGNDYVLINGYKETVDQPTRLTPQIADRHFGVGGDGMILVLPPQPHTDAHVRMRMFNADGSEAEMCGNGIRCVCKLAHDDGLCRANPMRIETGNGVLTLRYTTDDQGRVNQVTVDMGQPILEPHRIPVNILNLDRVVNHPITGLIEWPASLGRDWLQQCGLEQRMTCLSMGNPHAIFYCDDVAKVPLAQVGPMLETHPVFPTRTNAHFVQINARNEATMRTWERGSGTTLACGTGASAVCVAGVLTDRSDPSCLIHLPGGDLTIQWDQATNHVHMTGPATLAFTGEWDPSAHALRG